MGGLVSWCCRLLKKTEFGRLGKLESLWWFAVKVFGHWTVSDLAALCSFVSLWCFWFWRYFAWKIVEEQAMNLWWKWSSSQLGYSCMWTDLLVSNMNQLRLLWDICPWVHHSGVVLQVEFVAFRFAPKNGSYHGMVDLHFFYHPIARWIFGLQMRNPSNSQLTNWQSFPRWWRWWVDWVCGGEKRFEVTYMYIMHTDHIGKNMLIMSQCHTLFHISHIYDIWWLCISISYVLVYRQQWQGIARG